MARPDAPWTTDEVANRFHEAAITARRLPPVRVQGYFNTWPPIVRQAWEVLGADDAIYRSYPPTPQAVEQPAGRRGCQSTSVVPPIAEPRATPVAVRRGQGW